MSEYQLCPKCQGQGSVQVPPGLPAMPDGSFEWVDNCAGHLCDVCKGEKVILKLEDRYEVYQIPDPDIEPPEYDVVSEGAMSPKEYREKYPNASKVTGRG